ncbi:MAG: hypothetical protein LUD12_02250 [Lachnospiraceae bacterium]|nr:hypothetical protein [Lachnospiraceae bacterium]
MTEKEVLHYWNYFCSLTRRLQNTTQYVDHRADNNGNLKNGNVCSFEFQQIITLAAIEFENVSKIICLEIDPDFNYKSSSIKNITKKILKEYPLITETEIDSDYQMLKPLEGWHIGKDKKDEEGKEGKDKVFGLEWWNDNTDLKHQAFIRFDSATLKNAVSSVASLMVMELYLMQIMLKTLVMAIDKKCDYFVCNYAGNILYTGGEQLPDFQKE